MFCSGSWQRAFLLCSPELSSVLGLQCWPSQSYHCGGVSEKREADASRYPYTIFFLASFFAI